VEPDGTLTSIPVTVLVPTRNEELNLEKCLRSVRGLADQILVIDSDSLDRTVQIARAYADDVHNLSYVHAKIIPWIFQWALDNLEIRNEWVLLLEADQVITPALQNELRGLFARRCVFENGFYIRREQVFRGRWIRFGGYGSKYLLKLFRRTHGRLDPNEEDTRVYLTGPVGKLHEPLEEENLKEADILFYLEKHLRYADAFARDELQRRRQRATWLTVGKPFGTPDQRVLWLKGVYYRMPMYVRPFLYFFYRFVLLGGFLDGKQGAIFHFLQAFWFRLVVDIRLDELLAEQKAAARAEVLPTQASRAGTGVPFSG
jgi:glycosyltransferase involved in cell wall biosynthesis